VRNGLKQTPHMTTILPTITTNSLTIVDNESPYFAKLLEKTAKHYARVGLVADDAAYLSRHNCDLVAALGGVARFYPKKGTSLRQNGSTL